MHVERTTGKSSGEEANFDLEDWELTPDSFRHSTATYVSVKEGLAGAAQQCRQESKRTTEKEENLALIKI